MPYNLSDNTQRGCLYLLKHDIEFFSQVVAIVKPEYFESTGYQNIYTGVRDFYDKYRTLPTDAALVDFIKNNATEKDDYDYEDEILLINSIDKSIFDTREFIMDTVEDFAKKSAIKSAITISANMLNQGDHDYGLIESLIKDALLVNRNVDVGQDYFSEVNNRLKRMYEDKNRDRFQTILPTHNRNLEGGLCRKELAMVVAPPGVGKSLYLVNQGAKAVIEGRNVLYVSLEMSEDKIGNRFDSVMTKLKNSKLKEPVVQLQLHSRLEYVQKECSGRLIIKEFPTGGSNVNQLRALLVQLRLHSDFIPDLIIVDYLELLRPNRIIDSEYMAQQRIAEELRGLAVEQNVLLWTASQTNREARKVDIITDAHLGDSYGKIRPADWVISLNQKQEEYDKGQMRIYVLKARDSKQHYLTPVIVDYSTLRIEEPEHEEEHPVE
tara:strand:+ start:89126 stop:90436 length:1311 start_codon:yes stop_codon:yes gene_type:complete